MSPVVSNKDFLGGRMRLRGTRMAIEVINNYLSNGYGVKDIKRDYPHLTKKQIKDAIEYLDKQIHKEKSKLELKTT